MIDLRFNCVKIKADFKGRGLKFKGSGVLYPQGKDVGYDYVFTAQHILKDASSKDLSSQIGKIKGIEIDVFADGSFSTYKTIAKKDVESSLLLIGGDFLIIKIDKGDYSFTPFLLADDIIEEKPLHLYGISEEAQDFITRLDCKCEDKHADMVHITSPVNNMDSLHGMSGGGVFAVNQPLMYGVLWKHAAAGGEFHNVRISKTLEDQIIDQLSSRGWETINFINILQCKQAMNTVYNDVFHDINDSILVNKNPSTFPLETRFVMPDFFDDVQSIKASESSEVPEEKKFETNMIDNDIDPVSNETKKFINQYLKHFYGQLNATSNREVRIPATSILNPERRILLFVGGPGSGKSSLLKFLTLQLLKGKITAYDGYLPIWMPFSYMANSSDNEVKDIIQTWLQEHKLWDKNRHFLEYAFDQRKILLIADGIDEWGDEPLQADRIIRKVKAEADSNNLRAIFSSREYGITNINSPFSTEDVYSIAPLSATQQDELVRKCLNHYNGPMDETKHMAEFLSSKLRSLRDVDRMKENPMLLTILVGQYLQGNELPHNNIAAMDRIMEELLVKHQQARKFQADDYSRSFDYTSNKMMLGVLSKEMFDHYNDGTMDKTQAGVLLNQYLNNQLSGKELSNAHIVDDLLRHDTHHLGVLEERTGSRISFINRQLQEFMTAKYLSVEERRANLFIQEHAADKGLHQVVLFLFEMMPASAFVGLYNVLKHIKTSDYKDYYLYKLRLEVLVRSMKAPKQFLLCEVDEYIQRIESESDYDIKHDLLEILLDGLYNSALETRVIEFISRYVPSASVFEDNRLTALMHVRELTDEERSFVIHTIINGDVRNKILASNVIRKHIKGDHALLEMVNANITPQTMPEVVAFFIRSVITEGIDTDKENGLIKQVPSIGMYSQFYLMEFSLFKGEKVDGKDVIKMLSELSYTLQDEALKLLLNYYKLDGAVRDCALKAVNSFGRQSDNISTDMAWRYLLSCWINHPEVIKALTRELQKEYPFNYGNSYELWEIIQKQALSEELLDEITEWAVSRYEKHIWGAESVIVNTIAKDPRIKDKLLSSLDTQKSWVHLIVHPLINNWEQDDKVIARLQRFLDEEPLEKTSWIANYSYEIYKGDVSRVKTYLDRCILDSNPNLQKDRAVAVYIHYFKEEFEEKYLLRILNGEILMNDGLLGSKWNVIGSIIDNYADRPVILNYLLQNYSDDYKFAGHIIVKYHGTDLASKMLEKWYHMDARLRLMMVHKISNLSSIDERIEHMLRLFRQEGNAYVLCDTVLCLVNHLKRKGREEDVFKIAEEVFNTAQLTTEYSYKIRFCIYLIYHRLDDYLLLDLRTGGKEHEFAEMHIFYNDSPYIEKTIADEALYLLSNDMVNLKRIVKGEKRIYSYIVFFSKYVNPTSEAARIIVKYVHDHKDIIDDANILLFLKKVGGQKTLLRELVLANIDNENNEMAATLSQIIASDFESDEEIKQLLMIDDWKWYSDSLNRVSLNCSLNTNVDRLHALFRECLANSYELKSNYVSYNFIISLEEADNVVKRIKFFITETINTFVYQMIVTPLTVRLRRDKALAELFYEELMITEDPRIRSSFYSILSFSGVKTIELREWKDRQHEHLYEYGHDIVLNRDRQLIVSLQ